jgi:hypothetical protein
VNGVLSETSYVDEFNVYKNMIKWLKKDSDSTLIFSYAMWSAMLVVFTT